MSKIERDLSNGVEQQTAHTGFENTRSAIILTGLPIPPSSNNQYFLLRRGAKTYHIPSGKLKEFKENMSDQYTSSSQRRMMEDWVEQKKLLEIRTIFYFERKRLFTKDNRVKKIDVSNRLKALHDCIAKMFEVDDCMFFRISAEKAEASEKGEMVCVEITPLI